MAEKMRLRSSSGTACRRCRLVPLLEDLTALLHLHIMSRHTGSSDQAAEVPEIGPDELTLKAKIGGGQFGDVFIGSCRGKTVAIKKLHAKQLEAKMLEEFRKEVAILTCDTRLLRVGCIFAQNNIFRIFYE